MFKDKKFTIPMIIEFIMPWIVIIFGSIASFYYNYGDYNTPQEIQEHASEMLYIFYDLAMGSGCVIMILELLLGLYGMIWLIVNLATKVKEKFAVLKPLVVWFASGYFIFETLCFMFLTEVFTFALSI